MTDRATIDWLPPEPLTIAKCKEYQRTFDHIDEFGPIIGRLPNPKTTVVGCYVGIGDRALYAAFDPDVEAWVGIEAVEVSTTLHQTKRIVDELMGFLGSSHPDAKFAVLQKVDVDPKAN